jgi:ribosome-associated protein
LAVVAKSKKAQKVVILDLKKVATFCDYFVIAGTASKRQVNAVAQAVTEDLSKLQLKPVSWPVLNDESGWIVFDLNSVIVHIMYEPLREFYGLERLWSDAKKVKIPPSA